MFLEAAIQGQELESPTNFDLKTLLDPYTSKDNAPHTEQDVADAESLASSEEEFVDHFRDIEYFRFKRCGLSINVSIQPPTTVTSEQPPEEPNGSEISDAKKNAPETSEFNLPVLVNFESECAKKYSDPVGLRIERYNLAAMVSLFDPKTDPNDSQQENPSATQEDVNADSVDLIKKDSIENASVEKTSEEQPDEEVNPPQPVKESNMENQKYIKFGVQQDRLSCVINDILARLNRQGVLADPRDVCRRGGGRSGDFYEMDKDFFDDSLAFENLGVDPTVQTKTTTRPTSTNLDFMIDDSDSLDQEGPHANQTQNHSSSNLAPNATTGQLKDNEIIHEYSDPSIFTFDNCTSKDEEILFKLDYSSSVEEDDAELEDDAGYDSAALSAKSSSSEKSQDLKYVTSQYFINRRAWHKYQHQLSPEAIEGFKVLEATLRGKGNKRGLLVPKEEVFNIIYDFIKKIFNIAYPTVNWNVHSTIDQYSSALKNAQSILDFDFRPNQNSEDATEDDQTYVSTDSTHQPIEKEAAAFTSEQPKPMSLDEPLHIDKEDATARKSSFLKRPPSNLLIATISDLVSLVIMFSFH